MKMRCSMSQLSWQPVIQAIWELDKFIKWIRLILRISFNGKMSIVFNPYFHPYLNENTGIGFHYSEFKKEKKKKRVFC